MTQPKWFTDIQLKAANLAPVASEVDSLMNIRGYDPAGEFLTNISGQETLYGTYPETDYSMGITQIDPIRYQDIVNQINTMKTKYPKAKRGYGADADFINQYMRAKGEEYKDFDIAKLATIEDGKYTSMSKHASDPLSNFLVSRMLLHMDKKTFIPKTAEEQALYWKKKWNTYEKRGTGTPEDFLEKIKTYRPVESTMDKYNDVQRAFEK